VVLVGFGVAIQIAVVLLAACWKKEKNESRLVILIFQQMKN